MPILGMSDGRAFTDYRPHSLYMSELYKNNNLQTNRDFIEFMKANKIETKEVPDCSYKSCPVCQETLEWKPKFK